MPTTRAGLVLAEQTPRGPRARRGWRIVARVVVVALVVTLGYAGWRGVRALFAATQSPSCVATVPGGVVEVAPEQAGNAATISAVAVRRGLPPRAAVIAVATAMQESKLRNLRFGDRDSLGLFQQRPSQGWGTPEQILDPVYASGAFYDRLVKVKDWATRPLTQVAQDVQRSGAPNAYAQHEDEALALASALTGAAPAALRCSLGEPGTSSVRDAALALDREFGVRSTPGERMLTVSADGIPPWAIGHWAVARAQAHGITRVQVGDRVWTRADADGWQPAAAPVEGVVVRFAEVG